MRPRAVLVAASLVFPLALISGEAMALDVQQSCERDFQEILRQLRGLLQEWQRMHEIDGKITPTGQRLSPSP